ncbi:hypothetical protein SAMN05421810_107295 [Amycolatopsis arida]|uniref:Uncharacterized protein n=2 Tax=Amycolatopsis arida TaxID=587909 RepID=A0A1I5YNV6_9PSEU|nr:hypothetical protein CLV69_107295 [Amycolatopsis arida]SFQ45800.1 hypothetical protein SAMN05421810_107295 [Amycolatopsis arida]
MPKPTFRRPPTNDAARLLARLSPLDRVANLIFNRIRHPAEGEDFQHAVTLAFRISQRRSSDITDTGDLLLALLAMLARELADVPFRTTDLNQMIDEQRRRKPERRPDPRHQPG